MAGEFQGCLTLPPQSLLTSIRATVWICVDMLNTCSSGLHPGTNNASSCRNSFFPAASIAAENLAQRSQLSLVVGSLLAWICTAMFLSGYHDLGLAVISKWPCCLRGSKWPPEETVVPSSCRYLLCGSLQNTYHSSLGKKKRKENTSIAVSTTTPIT